MRSEDKMMASRFKAECLGVLDRVERTKQPVTITKHGRPVARLVPIDDVAEPRDTAGRVRLLVAEDEALYSTGEAWDVERNEG